MTEGQNVGGEMTAEHVALIERFLVLNGHAKAEDDEEFMGVLDGLQTALSALLSALSTSKAQLQEGEKCLTCGGFGLSRGGICWTCDGRGAVQPFFSALTDEQRTDIESHLRGLTDGAATYPTPPHGWTCFHCGETFKTEAGAHLHFGGNPNEVPACRKEARDER